MKIAQEVQNQLASDLVLFENEMDATDDDGVFAIQQNGRVCSVVEQLTGCWPEDFLQNTPKFDLPPDDADGQYPFC